MNVLSLFDGLAGCRIALERAGIKVNNYYASEIDKYAMQVANYNYPDIIQLGDIKNWKDWDIDWGSIGLLTAGFPCQAWSMAGKQKGDSDPRGALVHDLVDIWNHTKEANPNLKFMFENVKMKKEFLEYVNNLFGVEPIFINSALVSAQNRQRYYWTNIEGVEQPEDRELILADIIEDGFVDREKGYCIDANYHKGSNPEQYFSKKRRQLVFKLNDCESLEQKRDNKIKQVGEVGKGGQGNRIYSPFGKGCTLNAQSGGKAGNGSMLIDTSELRPCEPREFNPDSLCYHAVDATDISGNGYVKRVYATSGKAPTLAAASGGNLESKVLCGAFRGRYLVDGKRQDGKMKTAGLTEQRLEIRQDGKTNTLTTVQKDNVVVHVDEPISYRKLTPLECERLQTLPDNYTLVLDENGKQLVSNTQRYKMIGNGWTIDVVAHIFSYLGR